MNIVKQGAVLALASLCSLGVWSKSDDMPSSSDRISALEAENKILSDRLKSVEDLAGQKRANEFNPSITVIGDFHGRYGIGVHKEEEHHHEEGEKHDHDHDHAHESFSNGVVVKSLELELRGAVDPWADALVVLGVENIGDPKGARLHVEEAFARLKRWPGLGFAPFEIRAGLFKTAIGRMNRLHSHNYNQISAPMAMQRFLGEEGYSAPGLSANFSFSTSQHSALTFFVEGLFSKKSPMQAEGAEKMPSGVAHAWWNWEPAPAHYLDLGASALVGHGKTTVTDHGKDKAAGTFLLLAGDVHYAYQPLGYGANPLFLFGSEFYTANTVDKGRWPLGSFTWAQGYVFDSTFLGLRYDLAPQEGKANVLKFEHAAGVYFTHYTTEFLRFRLGYDHVMPELSSWQGDHRLTLSMMFVLGSHPVEPYFANR